MSRTNRKTATRKVVPPTSPIRRVTPNRPSVLVLDLADLDIDSEGLVVYEDGELKLYQGESEIGNEWEQEQFYLNDHLVDTGDPLTDAQSNIRLLQSIIDLIRQTDAE